MPIAISNTFEARTTAASENIIALYDYSTGDYSQWHWESNQNIPQFSPVPWYGRPVFPADGATRYPDADASYFGNGDLMGLEENVGGRSGFANRTTVKGADETTEGESTSASDVGDWDNYASYRRRTELNHHLVVGDDGVTLPYQTTRWVSVSFYLPADFETAGRSSWQTSFQLKGPLVNENSPTLSIQLRVDNNNVLSWRIGHTWYPTDYPTLAEYSSQWWYTMYYDRTYPNSGSWPDGLVHFPEAGSQAALGTITKGAWTDFIFQIHMDGNTLAEGGQGFMKVWKRDDDGDWNYVLDITPGNTNRGGHNFDYGIMYKNPNSGWGPLVGIYCDNPWVLNLPGNTTMYNANLKIGDENATFSEMSNDGTYPAGQS